MAPKSDGNNQDATSGQGDEGRRDADTRTDPGPDSPDTGKPESGDEYAKLRDAIERERELRKDAERKAREAAAYKVKFDELQAAGQSEQDKAVQKAREDAIAEVTATSNWRLVTAEARALAAEAGFRSPMSAVKLLDLTDITVTDAGVVDAAAIGAALKQLAADEPYLLADDGSPRTPKPDPSQGSGREPVSSDAGREMAKRHFGEHAGAGRGY